MTLSYRNSLFSTLFIFAVFGDRVIAYNESSTVAVRRSLPFSCPTVVIDINNPTQVYDDLTKLGLEETTINEFLKFSKGKYDKETAEDAKDVLIEIIEELKRKHSNKPVGVRARSADKRACKKACKDTIYEACQRYNCKKIKSAFKKKCCDNCSVEFC